MLHTVTTAVTSAVQLFTQRCLSVLSSPDLLSVYDIAVNFKSHNLFFVEIMYCNLSHCLRCR